MSARFRTTSLFADILTTRKTRLRGRARVGMAVVCLAALLTTAGGVRAEPPATDPSDLGSLPADPALDAPELLQFKDIPIVVAAGKRAQTEQEAAASVSVVTSEDIELFGYRSLADVLRGQRSFYLHTDGLNWFGGVRGFLRPGEWNARMLVLVDGKPTREPLYGQTHLDQDFVVPFEVVKRIEVVRGPGSALYGSNAVFGVINVVTKDVDDVKGNGLLRLEGGSQQTGRAAALVAQKLGGGWEIVGSASGFTTEGVKDIHYDGVHDAARNFGHVRGFDNESAEAVFLKLRKGDFTIEFDAEQRDKQNRSATYLASFADPGNMIEQRANLSFHYDHEISATQHVHGLAYVGYYNYEQHYRFDDDGSGRPYRYYTQGDSSFLGAEIDYDWQISKAFHLTAGVEATQTISTRQHDWATNDGDLLDVDNSFSSVGVFAEGEYKLNDKLKLTAGVRLDHVQRIGEQMSPRAAVIYTPNAVDTFKLLYGRAFRSPNLYELFYSAPGANQANPDLKPEVVDTYEFVWEHDFHDGWRGSANYYYWMMSDSLGNYRTDTGALQYRNGGHTFAQGGELELSKRWESGASLRVYGTLGRATQDGDTLSHSPQWIVGTSVAFPLINRNTFLAIEPQFVGPRESPDGDRTDATFITNITLTSRDVLKGLDVQVGVYNLFGNEARLPQSGSSFHSQPYLNYPEPVLRAGLTYRF